MYVESDAAKGELDSIAQLLKVMKDGAFNCAFIDKWEVKHLNGHGRSFTSLSLCTYSERSNLAMLSYKVGEMH